MNTIPRWVSTPKTLTDPRRPAWEKALNTLTGFRTTNVPPAVQEALMREAVQEALKDQGVARSFEKVYVPEETLLTLPPEQALQAQKMANLLRMLANRASSRAQGEPVDVLPH